MDDQSNENNVINEDNIDEIVDNINDEDDSQNDNLNQNQSYHDNQNEDNENKIESNQNSINNIEDKVITNENENEQDEYNQQEENYKLSEKNSKINNEFFHLYTWIDTFKFPKPKRNLTRDFSDGVFFVELLKQLSTKVIIESHNVTQTNNKNQKRDNWGQIKKRVNLRTKLKITNKEIENIIDLKPYSIENLLNRLYELTHNNNNNNENIIIESRKDKEKEGVSNKDYMKSINSKVSPVFKENCTFKSETKENLDCKFNSKEEIFKLIIEEKDNKINELQSTLELLMMKITSLEEENFLVEEMINRYKNKLSYPKEYVNTE